MNVTELYRELKMTKDEFFHAVHELGFDIGERAIKIDDRVAVKVIDAIRQQRKTSHKKSIFAEQELTEHKTITQDKTIALPEKITVKAFAERLGKRVSDLIAILMQNGIFATINQTLDYETAAIIAEDVGYRPTRSTEESETENLDKRAERVSAYIAEEKKETLVPRPPVIVIMGHVDHGKTTLLDAIRQTNVVEKEAGGITQHIGAYQVEKNDRTMTFIDTPGHEAFTTMRSRGARIADIAILVVAADDGVKPQTIESIHIMQEAELPFIVAINKTDKPGADVSRVKKELSELNVIPEDYGGNVVCVPVSATTGERVDELLDTVLLVADMEKEHMLANPQGRTIGTIIESHVDKHTGPVATILVQNGTVHIGDLVQIGNIPGRVRSMKDWRGQAVQTALPSMPIQMLGLKKAPMVGDILEVVTDKKILKQKVKEYESFAFLKQQPAQEKEKKEEEKTALTMILRADKLGSLEAIVQSLTNIQHEEVGITILQKGLGNITESDVALARSTEALVLGFHVDATPGAAKFARDEHVPIHQFDIIYKLIDFVKETVQQLLSRAVTYHKIGTLTVLAVFKKTQQSIIIGGRVKDGVVRKGSVVKILRKTTMIGEGTLSQLQKEKKNIGEVTTGSECGLRIEGTADVAVGDIVEAYEAQEHVRTLE